MGRLLLRKHQIDIFHYKLAEDGFFIGREMEDYDKFAVYSCIYSCKLHKYSDIFPLKNCMLGGVKMKCPAQPKKFLRIRLGEDVMSPDKKCVQNKWIDVIRRHSASSYKKLQVLYLKC